MAKHEIDEFGEQTSFRSASKKKARHARSDHKHVYEKVLCRWINTLNGDPMYNVYKRCAICGALRRDERYNGMVEDERIEGGWLCHFITPDDFPDLPIVELPKRR